MMVDQYQWLIDSQKGKQLLSYLGDTESEQRAHLGDEFDWIRATLDGTGASPQPVAAPNPTPPKRSLDAADKPVALPKRPKT